MMQVASVVSVLLPVLLLLHAPPASSSSHLSELDLPQKSFTPQVVKCCTLSQVYSVDMRSCVQASEVTSVPDVDKAFPIHLESLVSRSHPHDIIDFGLPTCQPDQDHHVLINPLSNQSSSMDFFVVDKVANTPLVSIEHADYFSSYCIDRAFRGGLYVGVAAIVCQASPDRQCQTRTCVRSCCVMGHHFDAHIQGCVPDAKNLTHSQPLPASVLAPHGLGQAADLKYFYGFPECEELVVRHSLRLDATSGKLILDGQLGQLSVAEYCLAWNASKHSLVAFVCQPKWVGSELEALLQMGQSILTVLFAISLASIITAFVLVYIKNRNKLFGVMTLALLSMLFLFYLCLIVPHLLDEQNLRMQRPLLCKAEALLIQYSYLSAVFWLSAMCFDIWSAFRHIRRDPAPLPRAGWQHPRFKWYSLWSWGCPLIVSTTTIVMDQLPVHLTEGLIRPELGQTRCFLGDDGTIFYFHLLNLPLLLANLLMYLYSSWNLFCGVWADHLHDPHSRNRTLTRAKAVGKLFFVMGITWIAEAVSACLIRALGPTANVLKVSLAFDCVNALQGVSLLCVIGLDEAAIRRIRRCCTSRTQPYKVQGNAGQPQILPDAEVNAEHNAGTRSEYIKTLLRGKRFQQYQVRASAESMASGATMSRGLFTSLMEEDTHGTG